MTRLAVFLWLVLAGIVAAQQAPPFTGKSDVMDGKDLTAARRHFEPGARTVWHSHDNGQLRLGGQGPMRAEKNGGAGEGGGGEGDCAGPNVLPWHGATATAPLVQINVGFGGGTKWGEAVTDAEYNKR